MQLPCFCLQIRISVISLVLPLKLQIASKYPQSSTVLIQTSVITILPWRLQKTFDVSRQQKV